MTINLKKIKENETLKGRKFYKHGLNLLLKAFLSIVFQKVYREIEESEIKIKHLKENNQQKRKRSI